MCYTVCWLRSSRIQMPILNRNRDFFRLLSSCCLFLPGLASLNCALPVHGSAADFDQFKSLSNQPTGSAYLNLWGPPDAFLISFIPSKNKQRRLELWVYSKHGVQVMLQDGVRIKDFIFNPAGIPIPERATELRPDELTQQMTMAEIRNKFGRPSSANAKQSAGKRFTTFEFAEKSPKSFSFINNSLAFVSAGMDADAKNPWSENESPPKNSSAPAELLGKWKSDLGELTLKQSAVNPRFFEGIFVPSSYLKGTSPAQKNGIVSDGTIDMNTGFVRCSIHNWDGHAEFFLSPDRKMMIGTMFNKDHGSNSIFYRRWTLTR